VAYTVDMMRKVVARALEVGKLAAADPRKQRVKLDGFDFDLLKGGMCQEFVRECFESALGWPARSWAYAAPSAKVALQRMTRDGFRVTGPPQRDLRAYRNRGEREDLRGEHQQRAARRADARGHEAHATR